MPIVPATDVCRSCCIGLSGVEMAGGVSEDRVDEKAGWTYCESYVVLSSRVDMGTVRV